MGGNPRGDRTTLDAMFALCRIHHGLYDRGEMDCKPLQPVMGTRGPMAFVSHSGRASVLIGVN
jgi:hypothetical protein